jgi:RNA polymerase sigma factor (sigma-70 family)
VDICEGDLVRRARAGDAGAFALLVERRFGSARALAVRLGAHPDDVDDIVQEAFLQAFASLGRLRDPDRFGAWLADMVRNISRAAARQAPLMLLADWPEDLHPASAQGQPSAEDLDRAEALRGAVAGLPGGQRRAVELYYFADLPTGQIARSPGAAKASLHKARRRLREHITVSRPDLIPAVPRRITMTTVRIAHLEPHFDTQLDGTTAARRILVVLADEPGRRAMRLWLPARHGKALWRILGRPSRDSEPPSRDSEPPLPPKRHAPPGGLPVREFTPEDMASRLLGAAAAAVTGVDIDELGPGVLAAQIKVTGPAGTRQVTAPPGSALALAAALDVPVRVADALMDKLAVPVTGDDLSGPFGSRPPAPSSGQRSGPRNLDFADGLDGWDIGGSSRTEVTGAHWDDYTVAAADGAATLAAAVSQPYGDVFLRQSWIAGDYRDATVTLRAEVSAQDVAGHAELSLFIITKTEKPSPEQGVHAASGPQRVQVRRERRDSGQTITGSSDWARYEVSAHVPADAEHMGFELTLTGPGKAWLRHVELIRAS